MMTCCCYPGYCRCYCPTCGQRLPFARPLPWPRPWVWNNQPGPYWAGDAVSQARSALAAR